MEAHLTVSLYDVDRQRDVLDSELEGWHTQSVRQLEIIAHHLNEHESSDKNKEEEFNDKPVLPTRRNKTAEWNREYEEDSNDEIPAANKTRKRRYKTKKQRLIWAEPLEASSSGDKDNEKGKWNC